MADPNELRPAPARPPKVTPAARAVLEERLRARRLAPIAPHQLTRRADGGPALLSFAQERLWFLERLEPGSGVYTIALALALSGPLDVTAWRRSLEAIRKRHEALRTVFRESDGGPVQVVEPEGGPAWPAPLVDLAALAAVARVAEAERLARAEAARPFDLERGPLTRALLLRLARTEHHALVAAHHLVWDGWSTRVFLAELRALYEAFVRGAASPLPELPVQYADYAVWQRQWLAGERLAAQLAFWRARLAGETPLDLPTDFPRPAAQSFRGALLPVAFPPLLAAAVREAARGQGCTAFMLLLAAFQAVLARYAGQEAVSVGTPVAGRTRTATEQLIGLFVNTLVLRSDLSGDPTFAALLWRVRELALEAHVHQDLPFAKLVEELQPARRLSQAPLFQVMFILQNAPGEEPELAGLQIAPRRPARETAKFDLTLSLSEEGEALFGSLEYATDLFERGTMERLVGHLETLLAAAAAEPGRRLSELPLLTPVERRQLLLDWNATEASYPAAALPELLAASAAARPEAVAAEHDGERLTYAELEARANRLARYLAKHGVGPEVRVGLCLERSLDLLVALLGVLKAGGVYVPLDPAYPRERIALVLDDAAAPVLLTQDSLRDLLPSESAAIVCLDAGREAIERESAAPFACPALADNLAYVLFTSGSTGRPKGVQVTHGALVNFLEAMRREPGFAAGEALLAVTTLSFDIAGLELYLPLLAGGRVVIASSDTAADGRLLAEELARSRAAVLQATPATWRMLLESGWEGDGRLRALCGGEALPEELAAKLLPRVGSLWNLYGPTETTIWSSVVEVREGEPVRVGPPLANTRFYVVDWSFQPVPAGVPGELLIGGDGLARGYLGRPELTAERFVPDPFGGAGGRVYRTGDLVRWRSDGRLEFLGRLDHQVKVRGFRIELGEVEAALASQPGVERVVVVAKGESAEKRLVAYVVGEAEPARLRETLRERLPDYMVPSVFVKLEALPLTPNGKVDRKALPEPDAAAAPAAEHVAPRTLAEGLVVEIWREVLRRDRIGVHDDFFDLGGHSLLATQVVARVRKALGVELPVRALFERPTPAGLAERIARREGQAPALPPLLPVPHGGDLPLSFAQERLWFLERLDPGGAALHLPLALALRGRLDLAAWRRSLEEVVRRHETLRTRFRDSAEGPVAEVLPAHRFPVPLVDLSGLAAAEREREACRLALVTARRPFDLGTGPFLCALVVRLAADEHWALATLHHIAADGWSLGVLLTEVAALYEAFAAGRPSPFSALPIQYADYAAWQRDFLRGEALDAQLSFWRERLAGTTVLDLPTDFPRPAAPSVLGASLPVTLSPELTQALRRVSREAGGTLFMSLLAGFQVLLSRYSGQEAVNVGTPVAGRTHVETERLIGLFINTLVLRTDLAGDPTFGEALARAREVALDAQAHPDLPFEKLVGELQPRRSLAHSPLFQVMFVLQPAMEEKVILPGLEISALRAERGAVQYDLFLSLNDHGDGLRGWLEYATDLFERGTMERFLGHFETLLAAAAAEPRRRLSELPLLTPVERRQVLLDWNATAASYPQATLPALLAASAAARPEVVAAEHAGERLTYAELEARANRLARYLATRGVGPEVRVGLCLERSLDLLVAVLGLLKTGGVYVPLDPAYPRERIALVLEDAAAPVLVTQEALRQLLPAEGAAIVSVDAERDAIARESAAPFGCPALPDNLVYVLFTSGSTGRPKGVQVTHGGLVNFLESVRRELGFTAGEALLAITTLSFDIAGLELYLPLLAGGRVVIASRETAADGRRLAEELIRSGTAMLQATPVTWRMLLEAGWQGDGKLLALCGGEALPEDLAAKLLPRVGSLWNFYGPTETTIWSSVLELREGEPVRVGPPLANTQFYVVDRSLQPMPVGVPGELLIGGDGLARGYLGRPELTAERFVPDPFDGTGERLYRTGDLVRWRRDGRLEFLGRLDHQVKVRGFRIELGEVEAALAVQPGIERVVVVARGDAGEKRLVAYVVGEAEPAKLREALRERLPDYMVPSGFVRLDALPLTPNGKVDRKALPEPDAVAAPAAAYVPPRTLAEELLAEIWCQVLRRDRISIHEDFFDLGGHSLLATRVVARLYEASGVELPLRALFESPTLEGLARTVERALLVEAGELGDLR